MIFVIIALLVLPACYCFEVKSVTGWFAHMFAIIAFVISSVNGVMHVCS